MVICVDFDGTCTTHEFPNVGVNIGAEHVLKELVAKGHQLILYTMRSDRPFSGKTKDENILDVTGTFLTDAVNWFKRHDIPLYGIQKNPTQINWTTSPKCYAEAYIDDAAIGCPLIYDSNISNRPFVDWKKVKEQLEQRGIL